MIGTWLFKFIYWLFSASLVHGIESPMVTIKNGTLEGIFMTTRNGREIVAFQGIPYAQPPLGKLRFEPPKPFEGWTGVRSAKEHGNICIHRDVFGQQKEAVGFEDCLYLNVYTPKLPSNETDVFWNNYPVMIFFHGGAWRAGTTSSFEWGPTFLLDHDVILVTMNYRLGPLGFLSTEDHESLGNQGMKDQVQALRWVHENIAAFSGDRNRITIFGSSAGAATVHYLMISPLSRGLFNRAISQSGTARSLWALTRPGIAKNNANKIGKLLDCPTDKSSALIECLRSKDAADIVTTEDAFKVFDYCPLVVFGPVIEPNHPGAFLKEEPLQTLKSGNIADVPWMVGTVSHEGSLRVPAILTTGGEQYDKQLNDNFMELAPVTLTYEQTCPEKWKDNVTKSIRKFYLNDETIDKSKKWDLIDLYTDSWFFIGIDNSIRDHLEALSSPIYHYFFTYRGCCSLSSVSADSDEEYGVTHGDDLQYIFPLVDAVRRYEPINEEDNRMVDLMTKIWANFAKSGNPTPEKSSIIPVKWKPVRTSRLEYLHIENSRDLYMADNLHSDRVKFWANLPYNENSIPNQDVKHGRDEL